MNLDNQLQKRRLIIIGSVSIVFLILIIIIISLLGGTKTETVNAVMVNQFKSPFKYDYIDSTNELVTFNNRYFYKYNIDSGEVTKLSKDINLPIISEVTISSDQDYLIFRAGNHTFNDNLGQILQKKYKFNTNDVNQPMFWMYNIKKNSFKPFINIKNVEYDEQSNTYFASYYNIEDLRSTTIIEQFNFAGKKQSTTIIEGLVDEFQIINNTIYSLNEANKLVATNIGSSNLDGSLIVDNELNAFKFSPDRRWISAQTSSNDDGEYFLFIFDTQSQEFTDLGLYEESFNIWVDDYLLYFDHEEQKIVKYNPENKSKEFIKVVNQNDEEVTPLTFEIYLGNGEYLANFAYEDIYIITEKNEIFNTEPISEFAGEIDNSDVIYSVSNNSFVVNLDFNVKDNSKTRNSIYEYLNSNNINPDFYNIYFNENIEQLPINRIDVTRPIDSY